ncbi:MAG: NAD(P)H-binding protein [Myxococcota bacterium]
MKLLIVGGTSRTGRHVVDVALSRSHEVALFCRTPSKVPEPHQHLEVFAGDARDPAALSGAVRGCDAVICILQADSTGAEQIVARSILALLSVLDGGPTGDRPAPRLVLCSARPVTATRPWFILTLLWLWLRNPYRDLARAEGMLEASRVDWRVVRPPRLLDGPGKGAYTVASHPDEPGSAQDLDRVDLALALVEAAESDTGRRAIDIGGTG